MKNIFGGHNRTVFLSVLMMTGLLVGACESPEQKAAAYLAKAEQWYAEDDLVKASIEVKNTLQIQPKNAEARFLLAEIAESRGDFPEMVTNLRIAIDSKPDFTAARVKLGTLYILGGATELAQEQADYLQQTGVDTADVNILLARLRAAAGDLEGARAELELALDKESDNAQALGLLASITAGTDMDSALTLIDRGIEASDDEKPLRLLRIQLLQQAGRSSDVDAEFKALLADYPEETSLNYQYARYLAEEGRIEEVEPVLRRAVEQDPDNLEARIALTQFVARTRGEEAAEKILLDFIEEAPELYELRMALARVYQGTDRPDEAYAQYEAITEAIPNEDEGLTSKAMMGSILLSKGEREEGEALIDEVLSIDTMNSEALMLRGALRVEDNKFREAVADFRTLLRKDPENKQAQLMIARAHAAAGDDVLAKDAYRRVLNMSPEDPAAPLELARLLVRDDELSQAEELMVKRLETAPDDVRASRVLIAILVGNSDYRAALAEAKRIGSQPGQEAIGDYLAGGVYQAQNKHEDALVVFRSSLELAPLAREPLQGLVGSLIKLGRSDEAVAYLENMTAENPENLYARTLLGQVMAGSGDAAGAAKILESTLEADEGWLPAYTALAGIQGNDLSAQINIYKRGLSAMPDNQEMALLLGTAYERSGRIDDAIDAYEDVLRANPELPAVANNLAALLADYRYDDQDSLEKALEISEQFETSDNPAFLDTLGWVYYRLGDYDAAVPLLETAVEGASQVPVLHYHLGMAYKAAGKRTSAKAELEQALANPDAAFTGIEDARAALAEL